jgi:hypothetical protein
MFSCPHCGKVIEVGPTEKTKWHKYDPGGPVASLGCGTLFLIAIIVAIFSSGGSSDIKALRKDIQALEQKIDRLELAPVVVDQSDPPQRNQ